MEYPARGYFLLADRPAVSLGNEVKAMTELNLSSAVSGHGVRAPFVLPRIALPHYLVYCARRLAQAAILMVLTVAITFTLINSAPGDMVDVIAGESSIADAAYLDQLRAKFGLDQPLPVRFLNYAERIADLDLGYSFRQNKSVLSLIAGRVGATALLMTTSVVIALSAALVLGTIAARHVNRTADAIISTLTLLAYATPVFWIGLMMIVLFSIKLRWLPSSGMETLFSGYTGLHRWGDIGLHLIMPALTLALFQLALYTRLLRASLLDVLRQDFIRTARAKGLSERRVVVRHALRNALLPLVTMVGMHFATTLGGSVVVESVFAWPGLGRLAYDAIGQRDVNLLVGIVLFSAMVVIAVNFVVDLLYGWLDPRIENA
jgi:peptide/nickel transport system permease protein